MDDLAVSVQISVMGETHSRKLYLDMEQFDVDQEGTVARTLRQAIDSCLAGLSHIDGVNLVVA